MGAFDSIERVVVVVRPSKKNGDVNSCSHTSRQPIKDSPEFGFSLKPDIRQSHKGYSILSSPVHGSPVHEISGILGNETHSVFGYYNLPMTACVCTADIHLTIRYSPYIVVFTLF